MFWDIQSSRHTDPTVEEMEIKITNYTFQYTPGGTNSMSCGATWSLGPLPHATPHEVKCSCYF